MRHVSLGAAVAVAMTLTAGCSSTTGDEASTEYIEPSTTQCAVLGDKDVTLTVPYSPGGGYDTYARLIAPTLGEKIGSTVVVENVDGAGGLLAFNNLQKAKKDGTEIAIMNGTGAGAASLGDAPGVNFELTDFDYVGRVASDSQVLVTASSGPIETWADVQATPGFRFSSTGVGASDFITPALLIAMFDLDAEVLTGFQGSSEAALAVLQGDVDGMTGSLDSRAAALSSGDQRAIITIDRERSDIAPDAPTLGELAVTDEQRILADAHLRLYDFGRPLVAPAGTDAAALACLRGGLSEAAADPDFLANAQRIDRPINYLRGEELAQYATDLMNAPQEYLTVLRDANQSSK